MATVTRKGQITLPKAVRDALGLTPGSEVEFVIEQGQVVLRRRISPEAVRKWKGFLRGKLPAGSVDEFMDLLRGERLPPEGEVLEDGG
jgi:antitoxin PrlF